MRQSAKNVFPSLKVWVFSKSPCSQHSNAQCWVRSSHMEVWQPWHCASNRCMKLFKTEGRTQPFFRHPGFRLDSCIHHTWHAYKQTCECLYITLSYNVMFVSYKHDTIWQCNNTNLYDIIRLWKSVYCILLTWDVPSSHGPRCVAQCTVLGLHLITSHSARLPGCTIHVLSSTHHDLLKISCKTS